MGAGATGGGTRSIEVGSMNEVSERVRGWFAEGKRVVLATLVDTDGPSPRDAGAMFAVSSDHDLAGAISGGCVESTLVDVADSIFDGGFEKICEKLVNLQILTLTDPIRFNNGDVISITKNLPQLRELQLLHTEFETRRDQVVLDLQVFQ